MGQPLVDRIMFITKVIRRCKFTYVPISPTWNPALEPKTEVQLSDDKIKLLEKLSLIEVKTPEERQRLNDAVTMATRLSFVDVEGVEPMYMLPNSSQTLRKDIVENLISSEDIKKCAEKTVDGFYVSSVSNISDT